jgi:hypothetical protein
MTRLLRELSLALVLVASLANAAQGEEALRKVVEIDGGTAKVVQIAVSELQRMAPRQELRGYAVFVYESDAAYVVVFDDPARRPEQQLGSTAALPTFEVEIVKSDLRVARKAFAR